MDENLVGYLLQSLDPDTHRQVEAYLRTNSEAQRRLELLRRALEPLAADADDAPPAGLWVRTLAHVARHQCRMPGGASTTVAAPYRGLPPAPWPVRSPSGGATRTPWRRADVLVAAALLLLVGGLAVSWVARAWYPAQVYACQNNLRQVYTALAAYSDHHDGDFPRVEAQPPRNVAGVFGPALHDAGLLASGSNLTCPANGPQPARLPSLDELQGMRPDELRSALGSCYAYSLGYGERPEDHAGLRRGDGERLPIMADRPVFLDGRVADGNSPNHGGKGQNVLYLGGDVRFATVRNAGVDRDDIYLNQHGQVAAGRTRSDSVLGVSWASPYPPEQ